MGRKKKQRRSADWFFDKVLEAVSNQYNDNSLDEPTPAIGTRGYTKGSHEAALLREVQRLAEEAERLAAEVDRLKDQIGSGLKDFDSTL